MNEKKNFFISYTKTDEDWAIWIDRSFQKAGYSTILQASDEGMEIEVNNALKNSECFICVLSKEYQDSPYCLQAWSSAYKTDTASRRVDLTPEEPVRPLFIPVKIEDVKQGGLLATRNYVSLYKFGKTEDGEKVLLEAIRPRPIRPLPVEIFPPGFIQASQKALNNLPRVRDPYFTGRADILIEIINSVEAHGVVPLTQSDNNLTGVGKTSIALEFAYSHLTDYKTVWWVYADDEASALDSFRDLALHKQIISADAAKENVIDSMKYWFNNNDEWLFIYDGANTGDFTKWLEKYLPQRIDKTMRRHVLITTRGRFFPKCPAIINIDVFNREEAVLFLRKRIDLNGSDYSDESAVALAERLGCIPLNLSQVADYIVASPGVAFNDCIALLDKYGDDVFSGI